MRRLLVLGLVVGAAFAGCGARTSLRVSAGSGFESGDGGPRDGGRRSVDGGPPPPGLPCTPGGTWDDGCNDCRCGADGVPSCTTRACSSGLPGDDGVPCPSTVPAIGGRCSGSLVCSYGARCGTIVRACTGESWTHTAAADPTCPSLCPSFLPTDGAACAPEGLTCGYLGFACAARGAVCGGGHWTIVSPTCTPSCPAVPLPADSMCTDPVTKCPYPNGCGGEDYFMCAAGGRWTTTDSTCAGAAPDCPDKIPPPGTDCAVPDGTTCRYASADACATPCLCTPDGSWHCFATACPPVPPTSGGPATCNEGTPCLPGFACNVPCEKLCFCGDDAALHCEPQACL